MTSHRTSEIRKLNFMTDHGSIRAITRLARRGCPAADRGLLADCLLAGCLVADRDLVVDPPRENLAAPRRLPLRSAAPMPPMVAPTVAPTVAAAAPSGTPRPGMALSEPPDPESEPPDPESEPLPSLESVPAALLAEPMGSVAGYGMAIRSLYDVATVSL